eukprot:8127988-Prorocentrum_lima.AAC.1
MAGLAAQVRPCEAVVRQAFGRVVTDYMLIPVEPRGIVVLAEETGRLAAICKAQGVVDVVGDFYIKELVVSWLDAEEVARHINRHSQNG